MDVKNLTKEMLLEFAETKEGRKILNTPTVSCVAPYPVELFQVAINFVQDEKNGALGLAAPQIGDNRNWFVMKLQRTDEVIVVVNPVIIGHMGHKQCVEGCFSEKSPVRIKRPKSITVKYEKWYPNSNLYNKTEILEGRDCQVFCHEVDHNLGILLTKKGVLC